MSRQKQNLTIGDVVQHLLDYLNDYKDQPNVADRPVSAYDPVTDLPRPVMDFNWSAAGISFELDGEDDEDEGPPYVEPTRFEEVDIINGLVRRLRQMLLLHNEYLSYDIASGTFHILPNQDAVKKQMSPLEFEQNMRKVNEKTRINNYYIGSPPDPSNNELF